MLLALLIYLGAHTGVIVAEPVVVNSLAVGAVATETEGYYWGLTSKDRIMHDLFNSASTR